PRNSLGRLFIHKDKGVFLTPACEGQIRSEKSPPGEAFALQIGRCRPHDRQKAATASARFLEARLPSNRVERNHHRRQCIVDTWVVLQFDEVNLLRAIAEAK